jgi:hypothetical protein
LTVRDPRGRHCHWQGSSSSSNSFANYHSTNPPYSTTTLDSMVKQANMALLYQTNRLQLCGWCDTSPLASHILRYHLIPQKASVFFTVLLDRIYTRGPTTHLRALSIIFQEPRRFESSTTSILETANPLLTQLGTDTPDRISDSSFWGIKLQSPFLSLQLTAYPQTHTSILI